MISHLISVRSVDLSLKMTQCVSMLLLRRNSHVLSRRDTLSCKILHQPKGGDLDKNLTSRQIQITLDKSEKKSDVTVQLHNAKSS